MCAGEALGCIQLLLWYLKLKKTNALLFRFASRLVLT